MQHRIAQGLPLGLTVLASFGLCAAAMCQTIQSIAVSTNHIVYSPVTHLIYASVPSATPGAYGSVESIDPKTGVVVPSSPVGVDPDAIAVSDDATYLYVGLDGSSSVRRVDLPYLLPDLEFPIDSPPNQLVVLPDQPHSVVVSSGYLSVYDDGVQRANTIPVDNEEIATPPLPGVLYGAGESSTTGGFAQIGVDSSGVAIDKQEVGLLHDLPLHQDPTSSIVVDDDSDTLDTSTFLEGGTFASTYGLYADSQTQNSGPTNLVVPDYKDHRLYRLLEVPYGGVTIAAYDTDTYLPVGSLIIPNCLGSSQYSYASDLTACGANQLAFRTSVGTVVVVTSPIFRGLSSFTLSSTKLSGGNIVGTVKLNGPAGPGGVQLLLYSGQNIDVPASVTVPQGKSSATFTANVGITSTPLISSIEVWDGGQQKQITVQITDSAGDPYYPLNVQELDDNVNSLAFDRADDELLAALDSTDLYHGNTIAVIDTAQPGVKRAFFVGSDPQQISVTSDGADAYVGINASDWLGEFDVSSGASLGAYPLGYNSAYGPLSATNFAAIPGADSSIAVSDGQDVGNSSAPNISIYDSGVPRTGSYSTPDAHAIITPSSDGSMLYAFDPWVSSGEFFNLGVGNSGLSLVGSAVGLTQSTAVTSIISANNLVYCSTGDVINPATLQRIATMPGIPYYSLMDLDPVDNIVYFADVPYGGGQCTIWAFNSLTYAPISSYGFESGFYSLNSIATYAKDEVAVSTFGGQIFLVNVATPKLSELTLSASSVTGGQSLTGTVLLTHVAPLAGAAVDLKSSDHTVVKLPVNLTVAPNAIEGTFSIATHAVTVPTSVTITATFAGVKKDAVLTLQP